jgi:hypothetical protein
MVHPAFPRVVAFGGGSGLRRTLSGLTGALRPWGGTDPCDRLTLVVNGHAVAGPARPEPQLSERIINADVIIVGPGSLYSDILPALLVGGVASTLAGLKAVRIYVANLLTEPGQTDDFTVADCLDVIRDHTRAHLFDYVLVNRMPPGPAAAVRGEQMMATGHIKDRNLVVVEEDLAECDAQGTLCHAPAKLARAILRLARRDRQHGPTRTMRGVVYDGVMARRLTTEADASTPYERMITSATSFWMAVREPFMRHDLTRQDVRDVIRRGLERTNGSYRLLAELFNLAPTEYERFLTFLQEYDCDVCILPFSSMRRNDRTAAG